MADLLFRSPHNTAAILFIDGGCESKQGAAIRGRKHLVPGDVSKVLMGRLAAGHHLASSNAIFKVGFSLRQIQLSPVELKDAGDAQATRQRSTGF